MSRRDNENNRKISQMSLGNMRDETRWNIYMVNVANRK